MMKLALIGDPVAHSRSPELHKKFLREAGMDGEYQTIRVPRGNVINVVRRMRLDGFTGINITSPLKEEAVRACDVLNEDATMAQAVNTIYFGRKIYGANTDGIGARMALETLLGESVSLSRVGVLGTGPTARAILAQLHETDAYTFIWGRDTEKTIALCERFECQIWPANPPEIVISCLPPRIALPPPLREDVIKADIVMDVNYGTRATLERHLEREVVKGDMMLEAQARASFDFWLAHVEEVI
ncbi:MAG: shikimate dehydrogenase [Candidatus Baltobacteraceae bacterium]